MSQVPWLDESLQFPPVSTACEEPDGLLAAGGDLSPERIITAYKQGIFPWYEEDQPILWWSPNPRTVIIPSEIHISKSMRKTLKNTAYTVTFNQDFHQVIQACKAPRGDSDETWITDDMIDAYCALHDLGYAHSVEVWCENKLVGGLYGLALGSVFFGESMFSRESNASKIGFITLTKHLQKLDFTLIDCQVASDHLFTLGAKELPRETFIETITEAITKVPSISLWHAAI